MLLKLIPVNLAWWYSALYCWNNWSPQVIKQYYLVLRSLNMFRCRSRFNTPYVNILYTIMKQLPAYIVPCWQLGSILHLNPTISSKQKELWFNWPHCMLPVLQHCLSWAQCCGVNRVNLVAFLHPYCIETKDHWTELLYMHLVIAVFNVGVSGVSFVCYYRQF